MRKSLKLPRSPAVALLHFYSWNATRDKERVRRRCDLPSALPCLPYLWLFSPCACAAFVASDKLPPPAGRRPGRAPGRVFLLPHHRGRPVHGGAVLRPPCAVAAQCRLPPAARAAPRVPGERSCNQGGPENQAAALWLAVPTSLPRAVTQRHVCPLLLQWNVSIHSVTRDMPQKEQDALKDSQFFWDENHPWDRTGHRWAARSTASASALTTLRHVVQHRA